MRRWIRERSVDRIPSASSGGLVTGVSTEGRGHPARTRWFIGVAAGGLILWAAAASVLVLGAAQSLERAERSLPVARDAVGVGDVDAVGAVLDDVRGELGEADAALGNPLIAPLRVLPVVGDDLRAVTAIAQGGSAVGDAVAEALATLESLPGGSRALAPNDGVLPITALETLAAPLRRTSDAATEALRDIEQATASGRIERISAGRKRILELLGPLAVQADTAAQLTRHLPAFLGADGPRTYLFGASTPAELRGTGGFVGSISLLRLDGGRPEFGTFEPSTDLPILAPNALPAPVAADAERWSRYDGTGHFLMLNRTPHFPAAAKAMVRHWEATQGGSVDGVIVADPFALEALLTIAGPADVPGYGVRLDADSVVDFVTNGAYGLFEDEDERKAVLGAVSAATMDRFLHSENDAVTPTDLLRHLGKLARGGHVIAFSEDPNVQDAFAHAGVAGELLDPDGDLTNVVVNSGSASKIDFYAERRIEQETTLLSDGAAHTKMTLTLVNEAPTSGQPGYIIGPNGRGLEAGDSLSDVSVYLGKQAVFIETPPAEHDLPTFTGTEMGHPVHDGWVRISSGDRVERHYEWRTADAWSTSPEGTLQYEALFQGQTVIRPTQVALRVNVPSGFEVLEMTEGAEVEDGEAVWSEALRGEDITMRVRMSPLGDG